MAFDLTKTKVITFDVYGTLIDWESGIFAQTWPLIGRLPPQSPLWNKSVREIRRFVIDQFDEHESRIQTAHPTKIYSKVVSEVYEHLAKSLGVEALEGEAEAFGKGIGKWEAFPDSVDALLRLQKFYKLVPLSNCDRASFSMTTSGPFKEVKFDAIYLAEDIGSYKPNLKNFQYLVDHIKSDFGFEKHEITHTAQGLDFDHVPAKIFGLPPSVWIARGYEESLKNYEGKVNLAATYATLGDMADAAEKAFAAQK